MKKIFCRLFLCCLLPFVLFAFTWQVGPTRTYTLPSQVSGLVQDNDTVEIDAGLYLSDVARWQANNLVIRSTGGVAHLEANGLSYGGKAIWVIQGANVSVEGIEFSGCSCVDHNGAGIRMESTPLFVRHCWFHDNEEGILTGNYPGKIVVENTEFGYNGFGDGYSHNIYVGHLDTLEFRFNYSHHAVVGQELKSRATFNLIEYNRIGNESTGTASREIDLPNGGIAIIRGNCIEQGPNSQNSNIVGYGAEGLSNPTPHELYLVNNTIVNDRPSGSFVFLGTNTDLYYTRNNLFAGPGTLLSGTAAATDTSHNYYFPLTANAGLTDPVNYDYHLVPTAPAIDAGISPGNTNNGISLLPVYAYQHPVSSVPRITSGTIDAGAYEFAGNTDLGPGHSFGQEPNISIVEDRIRLFGLHERTEFRLWNTEGEILLHGSLDETRPIIQLPTFSSGIYFLQLVNGKGVLKNFKFFLP